MPRGPRLDAPGLLHHVMVRGIERRAIFRDDRDRTDFLRRPAAMVEANVLTVYAWAFLPNHLHLLVHTGQRPLTREHSWPAMLGRSIGATSATATSSRTAISPSRWRTSRTSSN